MLKYRTLVILIGFLLAFPGISHALSLGEIKVHSHFAQPFSAEIDIPSYTSDELENLEVYLAPSDKFESLGLEVYPYLQEFIFSVEQKPNGKPFIKIYTKTPLKELSISFVVEASWIGGKIIKDYHVLLTPEAITELREDQLLQRQLAVVDAKPNNDAQITSPNEPLEPEQTPVFIDQPIQPISQTVEEIEQPLPRQERSSSEIKKFGANGVQYDVGRGETLSQIAMKVKGDSNASMHQAMVALYEQNMQAFVDNNINKLKAGSTLTIKDINDFKAKSKRDAYSLAQQYMRGPQPQAETATQVAQAEPTEVEQENTGNRLEISSASEEPVPLEVIERLKQEQIATTEEELANAKKTASDLQAQNEELRERIAALESRMDNLAMQLFQANTGAVPSTAPHEGSATQQVDNLVVTDTGVVVAAQENLSFMERIQKYQTTLSSVALVLLSLTLVAVRKKDQIKLAIENFKNKPGKNKNKDIV